MERERTKQLLPLPPEIIGQRIFLIRGQKVMIDRDLAELYNVSTGNLNKAIKRNPSRFPEDFMFRLSETEYKALIFQFGISKKGGTRHLPYVFTELGVGMLSSVLRSDRAVQMNIFIIRAFAKLREMLVGHEELALRFEKMEHEHKKQSADLDKVCTFLKRFLDEPRKIRRKIGFS